MNKGELTAIFSIINLCMLTHFNVFNKNFFKINIRLFVILLLISLILIIFGFYSKDNNVEVLTGFTLALSIIIFILLFYYFFKKNFLKSISKRSYSKIRSV